MKWVFGMLAGAAVLVGLFCWRDVASYSSTAFSQARECFKENVPITFEIDRARDMIKGLGPEIKKNLHVIAKEEVEVARLEREIATLDERLSHDKGDILRLKNDVEQGGETYTYAGRKFSATQVKMDLSNRFARYKTNDATREKLTKILAARQASLDGARQKLDAMIAAKRQLEVDVENLAARQRMVEVAQTTSDLHLDNSQLSQTRELLDDLRTRVDVAERLVAAEAPTNVEIPLEEPASSNILDEVTTYFSGETPRSTETASK